MELYTKTSGEVANTLPIAPSRGSAIVTALIEGMAPRDAQGFSILTVHNPPQARHGQG
jgi:hypothetical protein